MAANGAGGAEPPPAEEVVYQVPASVLWRSCANRPLEGPKWTNCPIQSKQRIWTLRMTMIQQVQIESISRTGCRRDFMKRRPEECYDLIENMTAHHNDWDTSAQRNESSSSITSSNPEIASLKLQMEEMNRINKNASNKPTSKLKAITTRSGLVLDEPSVPMPPPFINPEEDERVEETFTDPEHVKIAQTFNLKKLPERLGDPGKFLIPCGFSELKCKALADLAIYVSPSFWEDHLNGPLVLDYVHRKEIFSIAGNERLILNMRNETSSYSNEPHQESINMIDVYNVSHEEIREDLFATNHPSGNPTSLVSTHTNLTSPEVNDDIFDPEEDIIKNLLNLDKTKDLPPYHDNQSSGNPTPISEPETKSSSSSPTLISLEESKLIWEEFEAYLQVIHSPRKYGSTTSSSPSLHISETSNYFLEEFADELAHITFPPGNDDLPFDAESDLLELEYLLNHDPIKDMDSILEDSVDENSLDDNLVDTISEMFTDEHALDYSSPPLWDDYDDNLFDHETVNDDTYDDPFDFKKEKIKDSKILI
ncbi:hypothetical protein Tco_1517959 [Tanacetum coccineum]